MAHKWICLIFLSKKHDIITKSLQCSKTHLHCPFFVCVGGSDPVDLHLPLVKSVIEKTALKHLKTILKQKPKGRHINYTKLELSEVKNIPITIQK